MELPLDTDGGGLSGSRAGVSLKYIRYVGSLTQHAVAWLSHRCPLTEATSQAKMLIGTKSGSGNQHHQGVLAGMISSSGPALEEMNT